MQSEIISNLKKRIMRRVHFFFMLRNLAPLAFDFALLAVVAFIVTLFVSVKQVLANLSVASSGGGISSFSFTAISETEIQTKLLLLVFGAIGFFAVRHLKQAVRAARVLRDGKKAIFPPQKADNEPR